MAPSRSLTDLPPELLDHITARLPTAHDLTTLSHVNKSLHSYVEKDAWQTFNRKRFPSLAPTNISSHKDAARTLTTLSKAWDRRAFVARYTEPSGDIRGFPGDKEIPKWMKQKGQTIGFTPHIDCYEEVVTSWGDRREVLAYSAGAELCVRDTRRGGMSRHVDRSEDVKWLTYRPLSAYEGRDDVTAVHLMRPREGEDCREQEVITGTANGDFQLLQLPGEPEKSNVKSRFTTQGQPVRSSSLLQQKGKPPILAANIGDSRICLYPVDSAQPKISPSSETQIGTPSNSHRSYRAWSTTFLSSAALAVGVGPCDEPLHIYTLTPSGLSKDATRKFPLQNDIPPQSDESHPTGSAHKSTSSIYPIVPLPPNSTPSADSGQLFLTGAYDGAVRLHDLRSPSAVVQTYTDTDDSPVYSLLPHGREKLAVGSASLSLLKIFDLRLGAKCYSYLETSDAQHSTQLTNNTTHRPTQPSASSDYGIFLNPAPETRPSTNGHRGGHRSLQRSRRNQASSVYSLASPSSASPHMYIGVENAVLQMSFTSLADRHPDPTFFSREEGWGGGRCGGHGREVVGVGMFDYKDDKGRLLVQGGPGGVDAELDERWGLSS